MPRGARHGAARVALVLGTSTSSIGATEEAYRASRRRRRVPGRQSQPARPHAAFAGRFRAARRWVCEGPCVTVATACSSSAKVFARPSACCASAWSTRPSSAASTPCAAACCSASTRCSWCRPNRAGRSTPSATASASARPPASRCSNGPRTATPGCSCVGYGESSDAHHMSHAAPRGAGRASCAIDDALARAGLEAADVDYVNLHGTASQQERRGRSARCWRAGSRPRTHASSTKGWTGHTLGAAGIVEAVISAAGARARPASRHRQLAHPGSGLRSADPARQRTPGEVRCAMSNSFGFGGNNCVLVFSAGRT